MRSVNIAELKDNLSRYLNEVRRGREVLIKDRNRPFARIVPLEDSHDDAELLELVASGDITLPKRSDPLPKGFWTKPLPRTSLDLIAVVRKERDAR